MDKKQNNDIEQSKIQNNQPAKSEDKLAISFALFAASACLLTSKVTIYNQIVSQNIAFILCILGVIAISIGFEIMLKIESNDIIIAAICFAAFPYSKVLFSRVDTISIVYSVASRLHSDPLRINLILLTIFLLILYSTFSLQSLLNLYHSIILLSSSTYLKILFYKLSIHINFIKEYIYEHKEIVNTIIVEFIQLLILIIGFLFLFFTIIRFAEKAFEAYSSALKKKKNENKSKTNETNEETITNLERLIAFLVSIATLILTVLQAIYINMGDHKL